MLWFLCLVRYYHHKLTATPVLHCTLKRWFRQCLLTSVPASPPAPAPTSPECERHQVPRQERPPHADPSEEALQVSLRQELQDVAGPETPHYQLPPARLHRNPAQDSRLEPVAAAIKYPKHSPVPSRFSFPNPLLYPPHTLKDQVHALSCS